jgi:hypothetical protein
MRFNETTRIMSICVLILAIIYTLIYSGVSGILLCAAVGFIAAAFIEQTELVVAVTVLFVVGYSMILKQYLRRFEGFENNAKDITERIRKESNDYEGNPVSAVKQSFMEGFEDVSNQKDSTAAPAVPHEAVDPKAAKEVTAAIDETKHDSTKNDVGASAIAKEEFESATNQLFKLGKMPSEHKEGPLLDAGSTLMKAMGSVDPDTTKKMTKDTKDLLETQKTLMNMMTQMRPILADGKELLQTFGGMFGGQK